MPNKSKAPSVWSKLWSAPKGPKKAHGATKKDPKLGESTIAEFINFGGKFRDPKQKAKGKAKTY